MSGTPGTRSTRTSELAQQILADWRVRLGGRWGQLADADKERLAQLAGDEAWIALRSLGAVEQADLDRLARDRQHVRAQFAALLAMHVDVAAATLNDTLVAVIGGALKLLIAAI